MDGQGEDIKEGAGGLEEEEEGVGGVGGEGEEGEVPERKGCEKAGGYGEGEEGQG